ncbi:MAG: IS1634 family transposase, partial [Candidatus Heimdallarchaeota archaeon]
MVHIVRKKKGDKTYLYLRQNHRVDGRSKQKWAIYLGPEHDDDKIKMKLSQVKLPQTIESFNFVFPAILLGIAKKLDLVNIINKNTNKRKQGISVGEYMLIAIINRCIKPTSKNQLQTWFDNSYLKNEFPQLLENLNSNAFSNHFKYLDLDSIDKIETDIQTKLISEFEVDMSNLFYDPTNFYTFINPGDTQLLPKHGHSKEGRKTLNIVNFSLFCSDDGGIPIMHKTYPGNIVDVTHFKTEFPRFLNKMDELRIDHDKIILIFDKGNISDELFEELESSRIKFICTLRPSTQKQLHHLQGDDFEIFELPNKKKVGAKEFANKISNRVYRIIASYEPSRNKWYGTNLMNKLEIDIANIDEWFSERLNKKM